MCKSTCYTVYITQQKNTTADQNMDQLHETVLSKFQLDAPAFSCERYGFGHIDETYLVVTASAHRYILQKINNYVFQNVAALMENISAVTTFLRTQESDSRRVLSLIPTLSGNSYWEENDGF